MRTTPLIIAATLAAACAPSHHDLPGSDSPQPGFYTTIPGTVQTPLQGGCWAAAYSMMPASELGCGPYSGFGNAWADTEFSREISTQGSVWAGIPANVSVFNDCDASQANAISLRGQQRILFGYYLFWRRAYVETGNFAPAAGILAHEWAHQIQFLNGWIDTSTTPLKELEADAFGGYYLYMAHGYSDDHVRAYYAVLFGIGDYAFNSQEHHGTPQQRQWMGYYGALTGYNSVKAQRQLTYSELHKSFTDYINAGMPRQVLAGVVMPAFGQAADLPHFPAAAGDIDTRRPYFPQP